MKYHALTDTIVHPFSESKYNPVELFPLIVVDPEFQGGDTIVAKTPVIEGDHYILEYGVLAAGSPEQIAYMEGL